MLKVKKFLVIALTMFISVLSISAVVSAETSYKEFKAKTDVNPHHDYTIKFNKEVDGNSINNTTIFIKGENGETLGSTVTVNMDDERIVKIYAPEKGYEEGKVYTLYVSDGIKDKSGKVLKIPRSMKFTIALTNVGEINETYLSYFSNINYDNETIKIEGLFGEPLSKEFDYNLEVLRYPYEFIEIKGKLGLAGIGLLNDDAGFNFEFQANKLIGITYRYHYDTMYSENDLASLFAALVNNLGQHIGQPNEKNVTFEELINDRGVPVEHVATWKHNLSDGKEETCTLRVYNRMFTSTKGQTEMILDIGKSVMIYK